MITMQNLHRLEPCPLCAVRMAVPGSPICTVCDAVTVSKLVPADASSLWLLPEEPS